MGFFSSADKHAGIFLVLEETKSSTLSKLCEISFAGIN